MSLKIGIASWDGEHITQHFGRAEQFLIYQIEGNSYTYLETRLNNPGCTGRQHNENLLEKTAELLSDCKVLLVSRIGPGARALLAARGILALEAPVSIEMALEGLISSSFFGNLVSGAKSNG
jgi:predicted Fe-Mo cluster-binding NifX family protein